MQCYKCHRLGHFQYEHPSWDKEANYAEFREKEMLLIAQVELNESKDMWFFDSGCGNHMCVGIKHSFAISMKAIGRL